MPYIQIKRSNSTATPASLNPGELGYSENSDNLFIGNIAGDGVIRIGGKSVIDELATIPHNTLWDGQSVVIAITNDTPVAQVIAPDGILGRQADGTNNLTSLTPTMVREIINVEDDADVTDATNVNSAGAIMHTDISEGDGYVLKTASETYVGIKIKRDATTAPVGTNDTSQGYVVGSQWFDVTADKAYVCLDNTTSAAQWKDITITSDGTVASTGGGYASDEIVTYASGTGEAIKTSNKTLSEFVEKTEWNAAHSIVIANTTDNPTGLTVGADGIVGRDDTGNISSLTPAQVRGIINVADNANAYVHATHPGDDIDYDSTPQSGATVFSDIDINVTTDTEGHVTDANVAIATRELTAGDIGAATSGHNHDGTYEPADAAIVKSDETETITAGWTHTGTLTIEEPTVDAHAATKGYVDGVAQGLDPKESVRLASTTDIAGTYSNTGGTSSRGQFTGMSDGNIDGIAPAQGDRLLLKDQTGSGAENGIWVITTLGTGSNGVWDRAEDFDEDTEVTSGAFTFVEEGTSNGASGWVLSTADPVTIGGASGTSLTFVQFSEAGGYTADETGITLSGNEFQLQLDSTGYATLSKSGSGVRVANAGIKNTQVASDAAINFSKMENLTTARALVSDGSGDVSVSVVTATEIGYLDGVTSAIQTQLGTKAEDFTDLGDSPANYTGHAGKIVVVNSTPNGLEFVDAIDAGTF